MTLRTAPELAEITAVIQPYIDQLFDELPEELTAHLCRAGEYIDIPECQPEDLALIHHGQVTLYYRSQALITLQAGDPLLALPEEFSLRADDDCEVYLLKYQQLQMLQDVLIAWLALLQRWPGLLLAMLAAK